MSLREYDTQVGSGSLAIRAGTLLLIIGAVLVVASAASLPIPPRVADLGRIPGIFLMIIGALQLTSKPSDFQRRRPLPTVQMGLFACGYLLYALPSTIPHGLVGLFLQHLSALVMLMALVWVLWMCPVRRLREATESLLFVILLGSVFLWATQPELAVVQDRLRGLTENANLLGFYAFVAVAIFAAKSATRSATILTFGTLIVLVFTGSRTSSIAAVCILILYALTGCRPARRVLASIAFFIALVSAAWPGALDSVSDTLFRSTTSRSGSFQVALQAQLTTSVFGVGAGREAEEIASSPLRAYVHGGDFALIGVLLMWCSFLWLGAKSNRPATAFAIAAIIHSIGEGWLLSAASPMMIVFILGFVTLARSSD